MSDPNHVPAQLAASYTGDSPTEKPLAGSYLRLSALPVAYDPLSPDNQRRLTREAAARNGERIPVEFEFQDLDVSARKDVPRPGFEQAIDALLDGRIRTLYVAKLDRLSRRGMAHLGAILDQLEKAGGRIVFVADGLDTTSPGARQIIAILAEQARAESDNISWRQAQRHAHNRRNGLWGQRRPYGYLIENGRLQPHPEEGPIVRRMIDEFLDGAELGGISRRLNAEGVKPPRLAIWYEEAAAKGNLRAKRPRTGLWGYDTVRTILTQPALAALVSHKGQPVSDEDGNLVFAGEGIATVAERARILAELERRREAARESSQTTNTSTKNAAPRFALKGLLRCGECGLAMERQTPKHGRHYFRCSGRRRGLPCPGALIPASYLDDQVAARLRRKLAVLEPDARMLRVIAEHWLTEPTPAGEGNREVLEQAKTEMDDRIADLYAARYQRNEFDTAAEVAIYESMMQRLREQRDAAEEALARLGPRPTVDIGLLLDTELSEAGWSDLPTARQHDLLHLAITVVLIDSTKIPIEDRVRIGWYGEEPPEPRGVWKDGGWSPRQDRRDELEQGT